MFDNILATEYDVSIPTETFILHGVIDLLRGEGDTAEIVEEKFGRTVAKIENHQFSNAKVKKCARLCDGCDMRIYCGCK